MSLAVKVAERTPAFVPLNVHELDVISAALTPPARKRPNREMRRLIIKIARAAERRHRAVSRARR